MKPLPPGEDKSSVVVIHDAVRPFIDESVVKKIVCYAKTYGVSFFILISLTFDICKYDADLGVQGQVIEYN